MRLTWIVLTVLAVTTTALAAPSVPPWEQMAVVGAQAGTCGEELPYIVAEIRGEEPYISLFYIFDEDRPFAVYDPKTDTVFLDLARDGIFERSGAPGDAGIGEGPCDSLPWAVEAKPAPKKP